MKTAHTNLLPNRLNDKGLASLAKELRIIGQSVAAERIESRNQRAIDFWSSEALKNAFFDGQRLIGASVEIGNYTSGHIASVSFDSSEVMSIEEAI